ncbi:MAG: hypothetical protein F4213_17645 [Boseongicola sp. SB0677_bin_26]|nr:hypothetical protein [Boseongicola sp. SB0665_bin_10]MYG27817.1 hypothetical protein [Boseongicola sp. SB0677_bin_26]
MLRRLIHVADMSIRLAVVATNYSDQILERIRNQSGPDLDVVLHFGDKTSDFKASVTSRMNLKRGRSGHIFSNQRWTGAAQSLFESPDYLDRMDEFIDHLTRYSSAYTYKSHRLRTMHDYVDYYHILADVVATTLIEHEVSHCLFFDVPHLAYDTVLFQMCKALNLETIIVRQSLFPNRFWSMTDPASLGNFEDVADAEPYQVDKGVWPDLFYMSGIKQEPERTGTVSANAAINLFLHLLANRPARLLNPLYVWRLFSRMRLVHRSFPKWRDPFARFFHEHSLLYFDHLSGFENQEIDLSEDYIYFPLQLQPELTTSALGGRFRDQAFAIESLARVLPDGVRILVKENPRQGAYMRGPMFFHRLNRIPSVTFLPSWADTRALTLNAKAVASITGTVGWEAICQGKPALVFGNAWYRKLAGVLEWNEQLTYDEIVGRSVDHAALQRRVGALVAVAHCGVVARQYAQLVADFDEASNFDRVACTLLDVIKGRVPTSFQ